jgi:hypothetical protein
MHRVQRKPATCVPGFFVTFQTFVNPHDDMAHLLLGPVGFGVSFSSTLRFS